MHKLLTPVVLACVCCVATLSAVAEAPKPVVVLSLSSFNDAKEDPASLEAVSKAPEMPAWLSGFFQLYAQGKQSYGLDSSRPWGAVVQWDGQVSAYAFVPVADAETLMSDLSDHVKSVEETGDGVYCVKGTEFEKELYAKMVGDWLIVSSDTRCLERAAEQPTELLDGLNEKYDIAVRVTVKNIPAEKGKKILAHLDQTFGPVLRRVASDATMKILEQAATSLDEVTLGWSRH